MRDQSFGVHAPHMREEPHSTNTAWLAIALTCAAITLGAMGWLLHAVTV